MPLFQRSVLAKHIKLQDQSLVEKAYKKYAKYFLNPTIQKNIRESKEEQYQAKFLDELFVNVLGYTLNPNPNFNLTTELKNEKNAKKADGAILKDGAALAVIELKGTNTKDLEKVRQQAFDYKANQSGCVYVITSNFEKLRFYINNAVDFEEFDLFNLTQSQFNLFYLCLAKENLLQQVPLRIKEASTDEEKKITNEFYSNYSQFKRELFRDLVKLNMKNDAFRAELSLEDTERGQKNIKHKLFKKSQKLIDRFLFIFFAEDRDLLPYNSTKKLLEDWDRLKEMDAIMPLYNRFKMYFNYLDTGRKRTDSKAEIFAYNGGLFKPDATLDSLLISDDLLYKHAKTLSKYDFDSQIDVNILGHIFENSLNEIESVNAEIEGTNFDKQTTKRKKDGVFYTPKYITKYIVDNTVGKLCEDKKAELGIVDEEFNAKRKIDTKRRLLDALETYRAWLLQLTICDPACGSGAFLNQALDFLILEHQKLDVLQTALLGGGFVFPEIENTVLENNIFGVDLNEESVEIAKLSLWLRTAQPRRKLNDLNKNIQCGNSLIESKSVAGDRAFNWKEAFPHVFEKGGFDVIIGNPPYVGEKGHSEIFEALKSVKKWKGYYRRRSNLYYFFIKLGTELLKNNGLQSFIIPREFTSADWSNKVRYEILSASQIISIVDFNNLKVFNDAGTTSLILTQQKKDAPKDYEFNITSLRSQELVTSQLFDSTFLSKYSILNLDETGVKPWNFYQDNFDSLESNFKLSNYFDISQGLVTGADRITTKHIVNNLITEKYIGRGIFVLTEGVDLRVDNSSIYLLINDEWVLLDKEDEKFIKPFIKTGNLNKWSISKVDTYIIYTGSYELTINIKAYLLQFSSVLLNRSTTINKNEVISLQEFENYTLDDIKSKYSSAGAVQKIMRKKKWWMPLYERSNVPFEEPKIIVNTKNMDKFTLSLEPHYATGGGAGGQNFIYLNNSSKKAISHFSNVQDFTKLTNAILNH